MDVEREIVGTEVARHQPLHTLPQFLQYTVKDRDARDEASDGLLR